MSKDVAKTEAAATEVARFTTGDVLFNSFDRENMTIEDKARAYVAIDGVKSLRKEKMIGKPFGLTNAIVREETYHDENGEIRESLSVILEAGSGVSYRMSSETLADSLNNLITAFGDPQTWDEPLMVQVNEEIGNKGFNFYKIAPAVPTA